MFISSKFSPAKYLSNPHVQTILAKWVKQKTNLPTFDETLELPDGDFVDITWTEIPQSTNIKPIVVLLHGLGGSKDSHYIKGMFAAINAKGWIAVLLHFRGCSGKPNKKAISYHSAFTQDIRYFTQQLTARYPLCKFAIIGYSLGGNVLTHYLAETPNNPYQCATIVGAPFCLASCSNKINKGLSKIYQVYLLNLLKKATKQKITQGLIHHISVKQLNKINTMLAFDDKITAPLNGFNNAQHYYKECSGIRVFKEITQPCLFIHSADDPFIEHTKINSLITSDEQIPNNITLEISQQGGHVGFLTGNKIGKPEFWLDTRVPQFLQDFL